MMRRATQNLARGTYFEISPISRFSAAILQDATLVQQFQKAFEGYMAIFPLSISARC